MTSAFLEHVNVTVSDPAATAKRLDDWFGWKVRWSGASIHGGTSYHIGNETSYIAAYAPAKDTTALNGETYGVRGGLNHIAVVVEDLDATEERIKAGGYKTLNHADYEPGRRFYFHDDDGIEFEVVSYA
ncbi:catechol 2,3-dioxygenase-like lactoylglutathione lyase family enzyme [Roseibium hamelinense]|uniref:Catechol 2,3-dioxygenase-like lactoylglutathione lyase family enzyme n=1 Tax=Roseibium hamelinense TaxID=150831 RepID=A0A562T7A1_9HYPH|nr:VOC family protein [Roseibium hamelinense]MTI43761.1 VOC family protein [Roseibium hamelinense]TWI89447.1 catechol 2,3-dioxygenase-like lactoylglutathione lyase family enzyme [Roseibium hamelinense]